MGREILFRGKSVNEEWIEGNYITNERDEEKAYIGYLFDVRNGAVEDFDIIEVIPKTVCQYTGLTDKNGRKIFEGDIVSAWSEGSHTTGRVKQRIDGLWLLYPAWQNKIMWGLCPNNKGETTVEIIGNIFDNPELIEN